MALSTEEEVVDAAIASAQEVEDLFAELSMSLFLEGDRVVLNGLSVTPAFNGKEGVILSFNRKAGRFVVSLDGQPTPILVKLAKLTKVAGGGGASATGESENEPSPPDQEQNVAQRDSDEKLAECSMAGEAGETDILTAARKLVAPGTLFEGTIAIPGLVSDDGEIEATHGRQPYSLDVLGCREFLKDDVVLYGRHSAYGDDQVCGLAIYVDEEQVAHLDYADSETVCKGIIHLAEQKISGRVFQYVESDDGYFHPSAEATHTFELCLTGQSPQQIELARKVLQAKENRVNRLVSLAQLPQRSGASHPRSELLSELPWKDTFRDSIAASQELCAQFRYWTSILDKLSFETEEDKVKTLDELKERGLGRLAAHGLTDAAVRQFQFLSAGLRDWCKTPNFFPDGEIQYLLRKAHIRMLNSFNQLDKALRQADTRLPRAAIKQWHGVCKSAEAMCAICMVEIDADEEVLVLPCSHHFHEECASGWLHRNTSCPNCRHQLAAVDQAAGPQDQQDHNP
mmetsp:Transcript_17548/g.41323  ORF Transcript_17548/g.41323 Transcript_17548/m.41323 type:complete len:513 (+) Transcript_17548:3-1541(+)